MIYVYKGTPQTTPSRDIKNLWDDYWATQQFVEDPGLVYVSAQDGVIDMGKGGIRRREPKQTPDDFEDLMSEYDADPYFGHGYLASEGGHGESASIFDSFWGKVGLTALASVAWWSVAGTSVMGWIGMESAADGGSSLGFIGDFFGDLFGSGSGAEFAVDAIDFAPDLPALDGLGMDSVVDAGMEIGADAAIPPADPEPVVF